MCSCFFRFPSPFFRHRNIRGNLYSDHTVIIIRIVVTPAVIFLFCYLSGFEFSFLSFPGHQTGIEFCRFRSAFSNFRPKTDQAIHILNPNQFPVLQCKQRVHQSIHGINIRYRQRFGRNIQCIRHTLCQICLCGSVFRFILSQTYIRRVLRKAQHKSQILLCHPP